MTERVKNFIEKYIDLINTNWFESVFLKASEELSSDEVFALSEIIEDVLSVETEPIRWKVIDDKVIEYINTNKNAPSWARDRSNSWARVDYMLEEINDMGFGWSDTKQHVINSGSKYGTTIRKLAPEYGWAGAGDYAFEWFNSAAFDQEYKYE